MTISDISRWLLAAIAAVLIGSLSLANAGPQDDADQFFAMEMWPEAAGAYEELLRTDDTNAANWFNLARARHERGAYKAARAAYEKAISTGYQPVARARLHLARLLMSRDKRKDALQQLEEIAKTGGPSYRTLQNTAEFEPLAEDPRFIAVIDALKPCNSAQHRQFDFWLGDWDVTPAGSAQATAHNNISLAQDGCVLFEQYTNGAFTGISMNFYDASSQRWHQTWMSNAGGALYLEGGLNAAGAMAMTDKDLPISAVAGTVNRVTWTPNPDGSVRQLWESTGDGGEIWAIVFDGLYTKRIAK